MWFLLYACTSPPEAPTPAVPRPTANLVAPAVRPWRALEHLDEASFQFPDRNTPNLEEANGILVANGPWTKELRGFGRLKVWSTDLPFPCEMPRPNYAPWGARLYHGDTELPFVSGAEDITTGGWYIDHDRLFVLSLEDPGTWKRPPEVRVPEIAAELRRRNYGPSGLAPAAFARHDATIGPVTRPALNLPAPGSATFPVPVPAGAHLEFAVGILPDPLHAATEGDGADASVTVDGATVWTGGVDAGSAWQEVRLDLAPMAGTTVQLGFHTSPRADNAYDYVVFGSPVLTAPLGRDPRHIVVVGVDTLRWDALGADGYPKPTSPELDAWARQAVVFDQARAPAPRTRPSFRTALTGQYPIDAINAPTIADTLIAAGFRTAGVAANVHLVPRFRFNDGFESWHYENGAKAEDEVGRALAWQEAHATEDTYLFVHIMDPHTHYNAPLLWDAKFTAGLPPSPRIPALFDRWQIVQLTRRGQLLASDKELVRARYDAEVAYTSNALERLLTAADALPGRTVSVIHSDHGEEFWDHGGFEHNHTLYDELVRAVLWIKGPGGWPGGPHHVDTPVGLVDLVPTLLDLVGIATPPGLPGASLRPFVDASGGDPAALNARLRDRAQPLGHLMFDKERWGVVYQGWKYILQTASGDEELYDLAADAHELSDVLGTAPPARVAAMRLALGTATGWPVGPGWRVRLPGARGASFTIHFAAPIVAADVLDPEASLAMRANLEWGEHPRVTKADVGVVEVSADRQTVTFRGGRGVESQQIAIVCDGPCPDGTASAGGVEVPLADGVLDLGVGRIAARAGTVILPTSSEADALLARPTDAGQLEALKVLGYLDGE